MIETSISVIGILFIIINALLIPKNKTKNILNKRATIYIIYLVFSICCFIPIFDGVSAINLIYSYFDKTSYLFTLIICVACIKIIAKHANISKQDSILQYIFNKINSIQFSITHAIILLLFTLIFYGGVLGFIYFDIYHLNVIYQGIFTILLLLLFYMINNGIGILGLISIILFCLFGNYNESILESLICPYIFIYCTLFILFYLIKYLNKDKEQH